MADDKKKDAKPRETPTEVLVKLTLGALILGAVAQRITAFISIYKENAATAPDVPTWSFFVFISSLLGPFFTFVSFVVTFGAIFGSIYALRNLTRINAEMSDFYKDPEKTDETIVEQKGNKRWERVIAHLNSTSVNDWKFAILEADIILDELLDATGYRGETVSDKLKRVEPSDFQTLDQAWEAHKVRNMIAHEGSDFVISEREARRIIGLYQAVFEEFHYV